MIKNSCRDARTQPQKKTLQTNGANERKKKKRKKYTEKDRNKEKKEKGNGRVQREKNMS